MHWEFVIAGYTIVFLLLIAYAAAVVQRGRRLSEQVPEDQRRYLD
ncbi:MAG: hypothetical protein AAGA93_17285 [Actinomycetota bacterium]